MQLDLFEKKTEVDCLKEEIRYLRNSQEKTRRSLYARHGELAKKYLELHTRLSILERNICKSDYDYRTIGAFF
jgi:hypothetical protein